jgi:hypothetical protein
LTGATASTIASSSTEVTGLAQPSWRVGSSRQGTPVRSW